MKKITVFVSYSHRPPEHKIAVDGFIASLACSDSIDLRHDGQITTPAGPPEGWIEWMRSQIDEADWIIVVCNADYLASWKKETTSGAGAAFESVLLKQALYADRMINRKLIPVIFSPGDKNSVPPELADSTRYLLPQETGKLIEGIRKSTWLARFVGNLGPAGDTRVPSADLIIADAQSMSEAQDLPVTFDPILTKIGELIKQFNEDLAVAPDEITRRQIRSRFRKSFCPLANELIDLSQPIPQSIRPFYEKYCTE